MQSYYEVFMQSPRINRMVESGGATASDFREVFKTNVQKRIRLLPEIDGMGKDNLIHSWLTKFDAIYFGEDESAVDGKRKRAKETAQSELILTKEQLYDMFQYILGIQRYEHQQLAQGCQVRKEKSRDLCEPGGGALRWFQEIDGFFELAEALVSVFLELVEQCQRGLAF